MVTTIRPNKDALSSAIDIYRDAMRPFVLHRLRRVPGATVERAISTALGDRRVDEVNQKLRQGYRIEDVIDVNDFPHLVQRHWRDVFSEVFGDDRTIQSELWLISRARNQVSHPGAQDLEAEYASVHIYHIANVLGNHQHTGTEEGGGRHPGTACSSRFCQRRRRTGGRCSSST